ncbi:MAG: LytTR family DNA-binding domain-containing protein [Bacteroidota bacterium]
MSLKVLVAEDKPTPLLDIVQSINSHEELTVVAQFSDVENCINFINANSDLDALFLDIGLYEGTAFDILHGISDGRRPIPPVILITGENEEDYRDEIVNRFREEIIFFIRKPFRTTWRKEKNDCVIKIQARLNEIRPKPRKIPIHIGASTEMVAVEEIVWFRKRNSGVEMFIKNQAEPTYLSSRNLSDFEREINQNFFVKASRGDLVNANYVLKFSTQNTEAGKPKPVAILNLPDEPFVFLSDEGKKRLLHAVTYGS